MPAPSGCPRWAGCENILRTNAPLSVNVIMNLQPNTDFLEIGEAAEFLRDLIEEKFPKCAQWDTCEQDCNCTHCRISHFAKQLDAANSAVSLELASKQRRINGGDEIIGKQKLMIESLQHELESLRAIDRERVRLIDQQRPMSQKG